MSFSVILSSMAEGMERSVGIFFLTLIFSLPLGFLIAFGRMSKINCCRQLPDSIFLCFGALH